MARYGMHLGTAFQLVDDVLDYSGDEAATGKHLGDDLAEGKPTLPLIHAMKHGSIEQSECVRHAIEEGGRDALPGVLAAIRATGALDETRRHAEAGSTSPFQFVPSFFSVPSILGHPFLSQLVLLYSRCGRLR